MRFTLPRCVPSLVILQRTARYRPVLVVVSVPPVFTLTAVLAWYVVAAAGFTVVARVTDHVIVAASPSSWFSTC